MRLLKLERKAPCSSKAEHWGGYWEELSGALMKDHRLFTQGPMGRRQARGRG